MKSKSMSERSSNGHHVETLSEDPTSFSSGNKQQVQPGQQDQLGQQN